MESRVVIVTGGGSGLGRAMALALLGGGHRVVVAGRRAEALDETLIMGQAGDHGLAVPTDITQEAAVDSLVKTTLERFGRLDVMINNAGAGVGGAADEVSPDDWRAVVETNLTGTFLCAAAAMRVMRGQDPQGGRIINNGSIAAHVPRPRSVAYTATKHAITGLTKSIELDGRECSVRCTQIDIGNASTPMTAGMPAGVPQPDGSLRVEPVFDPAHVGDLVRYVVELPLTVTLPFVTIAAADMPFIGRG